MNVSKKIRLLKNRIKNDKSLRLIILIFSLFLPVMFILNFLGMTNDAFYIYSWLWIGFYSTVFLPFLNKKDIIIKTLIIINIAIILFTLIGSLLSGTESLLFMIIKMLLPFITID